MLMNPRSVTDLEGTSVRNGTKAGETLKLQGKSKYQMQDEKLILIKDHS